MGLRENNYVYTCLLKQARRLQKKASGQLLPFIESLANFAWVNHAGRFCDGALENMLLAAGRELPPASPAPPAPEGGLSRTLHVASTVYFTGGHTGVLGKWIQEDTISRQTVVLTRHSGPLPEYLTAICKAREVDILLFHPGDSIMERARQLRQLSAGFDRVILHHHPDDAVPPVAFARPGGCPVAMFNHAHFAFNLGSGVSDIILNTLPYYYQLTTRFRFPRAQERLFIHCVKGHYPGTPVDKAAAKDQLGIAPDRPVILSIGHEEYFVPLPGCDFFQTLRKVLAQNPGVFVLLVGVSPRHPAVPPDIRDHPHVRLTGPVANPVPYFEAADLCLESFPWPSLGATFEAVGYGGAFPVLVYGEGETALRIRREDFEPFITMTGTEDEYLRHIHELLASPEQTREAAAKIRENLLRADRRFGEQFAALYAKIDACPHQPAPLPDVPCHDGTDNRLLASQRSVNVSWELHRLLPRFYSFTGQLGSILSGVESWRQYAGRVRRFMARHRRKRAARPGDPAR